MTIEERIQELRKGKSLSQEQLAEILGVSRQAVSKWESGQSLPEIEKLIAMSTLFEVTIDYILKGETPPLPVQDNKSRDSRFVAQILYAVSAMLLAVGIFATVGQLSDGTSTINIYGGLIIESVGIMVFLIGWVFAGNRVINKPLFITNILLAGVLPSMLIPQLFGLGIPVITPWEFDAGAILIFLIAYLIICGAVMYLAVIRKGAKK